VLTLANDTISGNTAMGSGGGINSVVPSGGQIAMTNTIAAGNTSLGDPRTADLADTGDVANTALAGSNNLVGSGDLGLLRHTITGVDPQLGPIQDNGGPTWTMAPLPGSTAIDAGDNALVPPGVITDQRGGSNARIVNGTVDIGAVEFQGRPVVPTSLDVTVQPPSRVTAGTPFGLTVTVLDSSGNLDTTFSGPVTVALAHDPGGGATLGGLYRVTARQGVATFSGLSLDKPGLGYTLAVSGSGLPVVTTSAFDVQTAVATAAVAWGSQTQALQTAADGLRLLPAGRNTDLPWLGIRSLPITLLQPEPLTAGDVTVTGADGTNYGPVSIAGSGTRYTITLARPIDAADRVSLTIGNALIAPFTRRIDVLPGDYNDDGVVNQPDIVGVLGEWRQLDGARPTIFGDINGDGVVDLQDVTAVSRRLRSGLPPLASAAGGSGWGRGRRLT
jgi:hypothetical protein